MKLINLMWKIPLGLLVFVSGCQAQLVANQSIYFDGPDECRGYLAVVNPSADAPKPAVLIVHDWNGLDDYERGRAEMIANELGYVGLAVDVYGGGRTGTSPQENGSLMAPFRSDARKLVKRLQAAVDHVRSLDYVDKTKVAAIGYCFGGSSVIRMAEYGVNISGIVSFHGGLGAVPQDQLPATLPVINAQMLIISGYNDPSIPPEAVMAFEQSLDARGADWEMVVYSDTYHSFTVPGSNHTNRAVYSERADSRSWARMKDFLASIF